MIPVVLAIGDQIVEAYSRIGLVTTVIATIAIDSTTTTKKGTGSKL